MLDSILEASDPFRKPTPKMPASPAVRTARLVLASLFLSAITYPSLYQALLERTWGWLRETRFYRLSTFETLWTVIWYAWIEVWVTAFFMKRPEWRYLSPDIAGPGERSGSDGALRLSRSKPRGMRRPSRRVGEILTYMLPLLAMDLIMIKKFADVPLADMLATGNYESNQAVRGQLPRTFLVPTFHNVSASSPLQLVRALPATAPSSRRLAVEVVASLVLYDLLFFLFHLSLHIVPALRRWHAPHHAHDAQLHPQVTNQLSVPERLGLVMLANFSLNILGSHVLSRTIFVPIFVWLLVEIHCGMDLPLSFEKILPEGWAGGARKHMQHHRTGEGGFEPFLCVWDGLFERLVMAKRKRAVQKTS